MDANSREDASGFLTPKTRHIDRRYRFAQEQFAAGRLRLEHVASEDNLADILTKFLFNPKFSSARDALFVDVDRLRTLGDR